MQIFSISSIRFELVAIVIETGMTSLVGDSRMISRDYS